MKCPNCGAEVNSAFCSFCGTEMPKQPVNIVNNYYGNVSNSHNTAVNSSQNTVSPSACCPSCGSNKISFNRESTGTRGFHKTVGVCKSCGNTWVTANDLYVPTGSSKNKTTALILCILLGYFGAHQFYAGKIGMGFLYFFTVGLFGFGWIVDIILIACGKFKDSTGVQIT